VLIKIEDNRAIIAGEAGQESQLKQSQAIRNVGAKRQKGHFSFLNGSSGSFLRLIQLTCSYTYFKQVVGLNKCSNAAHHQGGMKDHIVASSLHHHKFLQFVDWQ
jgi:ABC-type ATPase involved in cell division